MVIISTNTKDILIQSTKFYPIQNFIAKIYFRYFISEMCEFILYEVTLVFPL